MWSQNESCTGEQKCYKGHYWDNEPNWNLIGKLGKSTIYDRLYVQYIIKQVLI